MADDRTAEELQREKLMLEIEKLRQDILAQNERLQRERDVDARERWKLLIAGLAGGAALFGAGAAFFKVLSP